MKKLGSLLFVLLILRLPMSAHKSQPLQICPRCNGKRINNRLRTPGFGNFVFAEIPSQNPGQHEGEKAAIYAWLCLSCGYVELHTCPSEHRGTSEKTK